MYHDKTLLRCDGCGGNKLISHFDIKGTSIKISPFAVDVLDDNLIFCMPVNERTYELLEHLTGRFESTNILASPINILHILYSTIQDPNHYWDVLATKAFFSAIDYCEYAEGVTPYYRIDFKISLRPQIYYKQKGKDTSDD